MNINQSDFRTNDNTSLSGVSAAPKQIIKIKNGEWGVIINPNSGGRKAEKKWPAISKTLTENDFIFEHRFTEYPLHAENLVQELLSEGYCNIIVVGGDGTLNEVANGILTQNYIPYRAITVAMIPVGRGNDWGRSYNIGNDINKAIKTIRGWKTIMHDVGVVEFYSEGQKQKRYFINMADIGFGANVVYQANLKKKRGDIGKWTYLYHLFSQMINYKKFFTEIKVDDKTFNVNLFSACVGIGKYNGGGMLQAPYAITNDGLFEITIINDIKRFEIIRSINKLYNGTITKHKNVISVRGKTLTAESGQDFNIEADGEVLGQGPVSFSIHSEAIQMITGK